MRRVTLLRAGRPDGVGAIRQIDWSTRLPYGIRLQVEGVEVRPMERLRAQARGALEGEGLWLLRPGPGHTDVTTVWRVQLRQRWMRLLAPVLAPVFRWNHDGVMRAGEAGLRRHLGCAG